MEAQALAALVKRKAGRAGRFMLGLAGAPGAGKSTLAEALHAALGSDSVVVPMDGFHFDDVVLNARGERARKGAPHTFDVAGFAHLLQRIARRETDIAIPVFDRTQELSRAGAAIIPSDVKFIIVEGNYLLLKAPGWRKLKPLFDLTVFLSVPEAVLERRLLDRWRGFGFDEASAKSKALGNDIPNARLVMRQSAKADITINS